MMRHLLGRVALVTLAPMGVVAAQAKATSTVEATATVRAAISVTSEHPLLFGPVTQNESKTVSPTDPMAGSLLFSGTPLAPASVTFMSLPRALTGPGGAVLPIDGFSGYFSTSSSAASGTAFVPSPSAQAAGISSASGQLYIFFGATVHPAPEQPTGTYSATIVLQVAY
jgi:hypothetical protein